MLSFCFGTSLVAQISINTDNSAPDASAMVDVKSTTKGVLLPRMSSMERNNILSPATGLIVFDLDTESFWFYNGSNWISLNPGLSSSAVFGDADQDTKIELIESADDIIDFEIDGTSYFQIINGKIASDNDRFNVYLGAGAGQFDDLTGDNRNVGIGDSSLFLNTTGRFNNAIGFKSMYHNEAGGRENVANGYKALFNNTTGAGNVAIGFQALDNNITGDNNIAIGWNADVASGALTNAVAIGKNAVVASSNSIVLGDGNSKVGIGINTPAEDLHVVGKIQIQDGTEADGYALITDANGIASWQAIQNDNLGNHEATQNLDMNSKNILNGAEVSFNDNADQMKILLNAKIGNFGVTILSSFYEMGVLLDQTYGDLNGSGPKSVYQVETNFPPNSDLGWLWKTDTQNDSEGLMSLSGEGKLTVGGNALFPSKVGILGSPSQEKLEIVGGNMKVNNTAYSDNIKAGTADGLIFNVQTGGDAITMEDNGDVNFGPANGNNRLYIEENVITSTDSEDDYPVMIYNSRNPDINDAFANGVLIKAGRKTNDGANSRMVVMKRPDDNTIGRIIQSSGDNITFSTSSDIRLKENITPSEVGLEELMKIEIYDYNFITDGPSHRSQGFLAQQLYQHYPQAVEKGGADAKRFPWMVDYGLITPLLVKSLQDQEPIIQEQTQLIQEQKALIEQLKTEVQEIEELKALIQQVKSQLNASN